MNKSEIIKIVSALFHVVSLGMLFIGISLILDLIFKGTDIIGSDSENSFNITSEGVFAIFANIVGFISIALILTNWINSKKIELYLGTILLSESILWIGISLILILN